ncbi:MAG: DUF3488 and transglutaminase-like domain-containing protein [Actinobacteria bacterium]|nr:DUF3488 and transglutaminase-like domain-containing protein [Actinomycetota bacterium]
MKTFPKILYFLCFLGLAAAAALAFNRVVNPSLSGLLLRAVLAATLAGAPGLIYRRAWPLGIVLLPLGAYLLLRTTLPVPASVDGISGQYHFYIQSLHTGAQAYVKEFFPLSLGDQPELRLLIAFCVFWVVGVASLVGLGLRKAIPAVVLTLVLIGFSMTVDTTPRALWTALLFLILSGCLLVLSRGLKRQNWRLRDAMAGGVIGIVGAFLALALLVTAPSAVAEPLQDWRAWDPFHQGGSIIGFNWLQNYPKLLNPGNNVQVMSVQSSSPSYWRANSLETFTGTAWLSSQPFMQRVSTTGNGPPFLYAIRPANPAPKGKTVKEVFQLNGLYTNYLFVGGDPSVISTEQNVPLRTNDSRALHTSKSLGPVLEYTVTAVIPDLKPEDVVGKGSAYPDSVTRYLDLPFPKVSDIKGSDKETAWRNAVAGLGADGREWTGLYALNQEIVGDATDPYDKTLRIEKYLRTFYVYSLNPPTSEYSSPYAAFLFDNRMGYCQHFSGAMALLLRFNGIPARVAVGFATGQLERGTYVVTTNNAHAWVEAFFPEVGWVAFDPTPGRNIPTSGPSSSSPGFVNPFAGTGTSSNQTVATEPPRNQLPTEIPTGLDTQGSSGSLWSKIAWLPWVLCIVVLMVAWPVARSLWRERGLRRGSPAQRLETSLRLLRTGLRDYGLPVTAAQTTEEAMHVAEAHLHVGHDQQLLDRAEAVLFGNREATQDDFARAEFFRRRVRTRLRKSRGWVRTALTWYGVPQRVSASGTAM